jgi:uncharacterized phage infection (PIP) family protein YhgE
MPQRISDPEKVLQHLQQIEARSARFGELLELLQETANKFKGFEETYRLSAAGFEEIQQSFDGLKSDNEDVVRRCNELETAVGRLHERASKVLSLVQQETENVRPTLEAELKRHSQQVAGVLGNVTARANASERDFGEFLARSKDAVSELQGQIRRDAKAALEDNKNELRAWWNTAKEALELRANDVSELQNQVAEAVSALRSALDAFEGCVQERANNALEGLRVGLDKWKKEFDDAHSREFDHALEGLRAELEKWRREFEDEQFRKLDHVIQTYNLVEARVKSYEGRVEAMEKSVAESAEAVQACVSQLGDLKGSWEDAKQGLEKLIADSNARCETLLQESRDKSERDIRSTQITFGRKLRGMRILVAGLALLTASAVGLAAYALWRGMP